MSSHEFIDLLPSAVAPPLLPSPELTGEAGVDAADPLSHPAVLAALAAGAVTLPSKARVSVRSRAASRRTSPGPSTAAPPQPPDAGSASSAAVQELSRVLAAALAKAAPAPPFAPPVPSVLDTVVPPPAFSGTNTTTTEFNEFAFQLARALRQRHLRPPTFELPNPLPPPPPAPPSTPSPWVSSTR